MANPASGAFHELQTLLRVGAVGGLTDAELVHRFAGRGDAAAFEALVGRHGPMVLRVCTAALGNADDAQDACQATFLVFARRAGTIRNGGAVGCWLHGVARRVATRSRNQAARRRLVERRAAERTPETVDDAPSRVQWAELHEEIDRLPETYRAPLILCGLEGRTHEEAAHQLGWPVGTVKVRLSRGRSRLGVRLARRGLVPSVVLAGFCQTKSPGSVLWLIGSRAAVHGTTAAGSPRSAIALADAVSRGLTVSRLRNAAVALLAASGMTLTIGWGLTFAAVADDPPVKAAAPVEKAGPTKPGPVPARQGGRNMADLFPFMNQPERHQEGNLSQVGNMRPLITDEFGVRFQSREAVLYWNGTVKLWSWQQKDPVCPPLSHDGPIRELRFVDHLNLLVTASDDTVKIWDGLTGALKKEIHGQTVRPLFFTGEWGSNRFVTVAADGRSATTRDLATFEPVGTLSTPEGSSKWIGAGLSGDGKTLATVGEDRSVTLWVFATSQPFATLRSPSRLVRRVFPNSKLGSGRPALQLDDPFWHSVVALGPPAADNPEAKKAD